MNPPAGLVKSTEIALSNALVRRREKCRKIAENAWPLCYVTNLQGWRWTCAFLDLKCCHRHKTFDISITKGGRHACFDAYRSRLQYSVPLKFLTFAWCGSDDDGLEERKGDHVCKFEWWVVPDLKLRPCQLFCSRHDYDLTFSVSYLVHDFRSPSHEMLSP